MFGRSYRSIAIALAVSICSACRGTAPPLAPADSVSLPSSPGAAESAASGKIQHVVIIVQENRTFDNMFHGFPGTDSPDSGPGSGRKIRLQPMSLAYPYDIDHNHFQFVEDFDGGKMDGFDHEIYKLRPEL